MLLIIQQETYQLDKMQNKGEQMDSKYKKLLNFQ